MYLQNYYSIKESVFDNNFCNKIIKKGESMKNNGYGKYLLNITEKTY